MQAAGKREILRRFHPSTRKIGARQGPQFAPQNDRLCLARRVSLNDSVRFAFADTAAARSRGGLALV